MRTIAEDDVTNITPLEGWLTLTEAGQVWGVTKQGAFRIVFESPNSAINVERDVRGVGERILVIRTAAVNREKKRRDALAQEKQGRQNEPTPSPRKRVQKPGNG